MYTRQAGSPASEGVHWVSQGEGDFTVGAVDKPQRGTKIVLHLKEGEEEFADGFRLRNLVRKYSDHISLPVIMQTEPGHVEEGEEPAAPEDETVNAATALSSKKFSTVTSNTCDSP